MRRRPAALLRMARTEEARQAHRPAVRLARELGRWDLVAAAGGDPQRGGVWSWREHGVRDDAFIGVLTEALEHVDRCRTGQAAAPPCRWSYFYGWDSDGRRTWRAPSPCEVARGLRRSRTAARGAAHPDASPRCGPGLARAMRLALIEEVARADPRASSASSSCSSSGSRLYELRPAGRGGRRHAAVRRGGRGSCGTPASRSRWPGGGSPAPATSTTRVAARDRCRPGAAPGQRLHRQRASCECVAAIRLNPPGRPVDPSVVRQRTASRNPGLRAMVAHAVLEAGDPADVRRAARRACPPTASDYCVLAGHCLPRAGARADRRPEEVSDGARADRGVRRTRRCNYGSVDHLGRGDHFLACGVRRPRGPPGTRARRSGPSCSMSGCSAPLAASLRGAARRAHGLMRPGPA